MTDVANGAKPSHLRRNMLIAVVILIVAIAAFGVGTFSKRSGTPSVVTVTAVQTATVVQTVSVSMIQTFSTTTEMTTGTATTETTTTYQT